MIEENLMQLEGRSLQQSYKLCRTVNY